MGRSPDLQRLRFHDLRHSHATQLLVEGVHPKVVQERLGHSSIAITLDLYSHVIGTLQEDAASRLDLAFAPAITRPSLAAKKLSSNRRFAHSSEIVFASIANGLEGCPSGLRNRS